MSAKLYIIVGNELASRKLAASNICAVLSAKGKTFLNESAGTRNLNSEGQIENNASAGIDSLITDYGTTTDALVIRLIGLGIHNELADIVAKHTDATFIFISGSADNAIEITKAHYPPLGDEAAIAALCAEEESAFQAFVASKGSTYAPTGIPIFNADWSLTSPVAGQGYTPSIAIVGSPAI